jgi:hypothetical protein
VGSLDVVKQSDERRTVKTRTVMLAAVLAVLLLAVAAVASACGSSSSSDEGVAELDDAATTTADDDETDESDANDEQDPEEAALAWAKCMREHGVDVPDPEVGEGGRLTIRPGTGRRLGDIDSDAFREARDACGSPFGTAGPPPLSDEQREQLQETMLAFAKCMREHGVDMPDPDFSGGGGVFRVGGGPGRGIDPDDPTFQKAQKACQEILEDGLPEPRLDRSTQGDAQ